MAGAPTRSIRTRALHLAGAVAMFGAGVYLIDSTWLDLGFFLESGRFALVGYTLAYAAALIAITAGFGPVRTGVSAIDVFLSGITGLLALLGLGILFGAIAIEAAFVRNPPIYWAALLALPAMQCLAAVSLFNGAPARDAPARSSVVVRYLNLAFYLVGMFAAVFLVVGIGYLLWALFRAQVLDGRMLAISRLSALASNVAGQPAQIYAWAVLVSAAGMTVLFAAADIFGWAFRRVSGTTVVNRDLDQAERDFVAASANRLRAFAKESGFFEVKWSEWLSVALVVIVLLIGYAAFSLTPRAYSEDDLAQLGWHLYVAEIGVSMLLAAAAGVAALMLPGAVLASLSEKNAEAAGWGTLIKDPDHAPEEAIKKAVEARRLSTSAPFDPGAFLRGLNFRLSTITYVFASIVVLTLPFFWIHDRSRYFLLTDDYIEVMDYWTLEKQRYTYDQVQRVDLHCRDGDAQYELELPDGFSVDVLSRSTLWGRFDAVLRVDKRIGDGVVRNLPPTDRTNYPLCIEDVVRDWDEGRASAAKEIFRLEAWQREHWRHRTKGQ